MLPELHRNISTKTTTWYFIRPYRFYKPSSSLSCTRYTTHRAGRCRKEFKNLRYSYRKGIDRSRIPHSTAFRQTYGGKALSLPERTDRYPQKRSQSKANLPYHAFEGIDLRQMAEQIKSRSEKKKKARLIAHRESLVFQTAFTIAYRCLWWLSLSTNFFRRLFFQLDNGIDRPMRNMIYRRKV